MCHPGVHQNRVEGRVEGRRIAMPHADPRHERQILAGFRGERLVDFVRYDSALRTDRVRDDGRVVAEPAANVQDPGARRQGKGIEPDVYKHHSERVKTCGVQAFRPAGSDGPAAPRFALRRASP
jgi:hypothetical protein